MLRFIFMLLVIYLTLVFSYRWGLEYADYVP